MSMKTYNKRWFSHHIVSLGKWRYVQKDPNIHEFKLILIMNEKYFPLLRKSFKLLGVIVVT